MCHQHIETEEEDEHGGSVFQVAVQLPYNPAEAQEADDFQGAEEASDSLNNQGSFQQDDN